MDVRFAEANDVRVYWNVVRITEDFNHAMNGKHGANRTLARFDYVR
ncbi:MAG TPA: hypothetical protein VHN11_07725 [Xanthobacteraceae bacterium]|nr:hypothetical protein [Xanthobacteraceae bacterium]